MTLERGINRAMASSCSIQAHVNTQQRRVSYLLLFVLLVGQLCYALHVHYGDDVHDESHPCYVCLQGAQLENALPALLFSLLITFPSFFFIQTIFRQHSVRQARFHDSRAPPNAA